MIQLDVLTGIGPSTDELPTKFALYQNYPNSFNPTTAIDFDVPKESRVRLTIYNVLGQEVARVFDADVKAGRYKVQWASNDFATGVYFYRLEASDFSSLKKLIIMK